MPSLNGRQIVRLAQCVAGLVGVQVVSPPDAYAQSPASASGNHTLPLDIVTQPWIGDLDGRVQRRRIRILTPYSKTHYFIERGVQHGLVFDFGMKIEQDINRMLKTTPATKVHVVFVPTSREQLVPSLIAGLGDIIGSNLTVTAEAAKYVEFMHQATQYTPNAAK